MSNLSELLPAGGAAKEFEPVASGTLPNGQAIILKANGQVEAVAETTLSQSIPLGPISTIQSSTTYYVQVAFDPNEAGKLIAIYRDEGNSGHGTAVVGTVSGTSITFGSEYIFNSAEANYAIISFDPQTAGSFVIQFQDAANNQHLYVLAGSRSGLGLTFGTKVLVETCSPTIHTSIECDPVNAGKFVTVYRDSTDGNHGKAKVGIITGTSISLGSMYEFNGGTGGYYNSLSFDHTSSGKFIVVFYNINNSGHGTGVVGTITGSKNLSFGSLIVFNSAGTGNTSLAFDPSTANSFVVLYNAGYGRAGTLSGNSFTVGSQVQFTTRVPDAKALAFHPSTAGQFVTVYRDSGSPYSGYASVGTVSGNSVTFATEEVFTETPYADISLSFDPNVDGMCVIGHRDLSNNYGATRLGQVGSRVTTNLTSTNFVGITAEAITSGATGVVVPQGGVAASVANTPLLQVYGSDTIWTTNNGYYPEIAYDPNTADKFIIAYVDASDSNKGKVVVGTISGTSVSYGTPYEYYTTATELPSISWDPNTANKFVVVFSDQNTADGKAVVGTVSGTSISYGTVVDFNGTDSTIYPHIDFDPSTAGSFVICFKDQQNSQYGVAIVGTMSGTSLSFGTKSVFASARSDDSVIAFDPNTANKCVICYKDQPNSSYGTAVVGTVSGTGISFGTEVVFNTGSTNYLSIAFDPNTANKCVIGYTDSGNSSYGTAVLGTVSGTSISFSSEYVFNTGSTNTITVSFDPNTPNRILVTYTDGSNSNYGTAVLGTVSGTSLSFGSENVFKSGTQGGVTMSFDPSTANKYVVAYQDDDRVVRVGNLSTALTIGSNYYVQSDGSVSTVSTSPAVNIGKAISTTSLILKG